MIFEKGEHWINTEKQIIKLKEREEDKDQNKGGRCNRMIWIGWAGLSDENVKNQMLV